MTLTLGGGQMTRRNDTVFWGGILLVLAVAIGFLVNLLVNQPAVAVEPSQEVSGVEGAADPSAP